MKKSIVATVILGSVLISGQAVSAEESHKNLVATTKSTAEISLTAGTLKFEEVPNLKFSKINLDNRATSLATLINPETGLKSKANDNGNIVVTNNLGDDSNWEVAVKASDFKNEKGLVLNNANFSIGTKELTAQDIIGDSSKKVVVSSEAGKNAVAIDSEKTTLDLSKVDDANLKTSSAYTSTVIWTLSNVAAAPVAG